MTEREEGYRQGLADAARLCAETAENSVTIGNQMAELQVSRAAVVAAVAGGLAALIPALRPNAESTTA